MALRTRVRRTPVDHSTQKLEFLKEKVDQIAKDQKEIARLQQKVQDELHELRNHMVAADVTEVIGEVGKGERFTPTGRGSTVIDKKAYFNAVSLEDFLDSVTVSVTRAKDFLSGKELQSISTKIPAEKKPETIRVVPLG